MNKIKENVYYIGVNDHLLDLFEGQYIVPNGMAYNSYIISDEKIAILDTVDVNFGDKWLENIKEVLGDKSPDYLIIQHMEPDHSACIGDFTANYPDTTIVGNAKTFDMLRAFFPDLALSNTLVVNDGEKLSLGSRELTFVTAPMVHWPEVMMTYDSCDKIFFSADAFGKFGALDVEEEWACEARRYYFGIVGKYGMQVQALFKKIANLDIQTICPLHGPILTENLGYYLDLYNTWSSYGVESEGIFIAYTSVYGNTKKAAELLRDKLIEKGCPKVAIADLAREDMAEAVEDGFRYGKIVLATTTYNGEMFPFMNQYVDALVERNYQNRTIGIIENGSWAAMAAKRIKAKFEKSKNITFTNTTVSIKSALKPENIAQINDLADELLK
ncbi:MAG: FprA family A-type flavoprotein [Ruminococcus sp.]|nr:FprA family A-type flavoprotein [Ruminococcus sp.]